VACSVWKRLYELLQSQNQRNSRIDIFIKHTGELLRWVVTAMQGNHFSRIQLLWPHSGLRVGGGYRSVRISDIARVLSSSHEDVDQIKSWE
jgi:hypothetical protein